MKTGSPDRPPTGEERVNLTNSVERNQARIYNDPIFKDFIHHVLVLRDETADHAAAERARTATLRSWMHLVQRYDSKEIEATADRIIEEFSCRAVA